MNETNNTNTFVKQSRNLFVSFWGWFWTGLWFLIMLLLLLKFVIFQQVTVVGESMQPNYYTGEQLFVNQIDKNFRRGQVVAVYRDKDVAKGANYLTRFSAVFFLKRVVGLPGEEIEIIGDKTIIYNKENPNGAVLTEDYLGAEVVAKERENCQNNLVSCYYGRTKIPENYFFLMGDNRVNSTDSRSVGVFPDYSILGQESFRFWPLAKGSIFDLPNYQWKPIDTATQEELAKFRIKNSVRTTFGEIFRD